MGPLWLVLAQIPDLSLYCAQAMSGTTAPGGLPAASSACAADAGSLTPARYPPGHSIWTEADFHRMEMRL